MKHANLILVDNKLSTLPKELEKLKRLEKVDVSNNPIETVSFQQATKFKLLGYIPQKNTDIDILKKIATQIPGLPEWTDDNPCFALEKTSDLYFKASRPSFILRDNKVVGVNFMGLNLEKLPSEITQLVNLKSLSLQANNIQVLPKEILQLEQLEYLFLSSNKLESLPDEISQLQNLRHLDLGHNQLKTLPPSIGGLKKLETLMLSSNNLTSIPFGIQNLKNLTQISAEKNRLTEFSKGLCFLSKLKYIDLSANLISSIPEEIEQLSNLNRLQLSNNRISSLPSGISKLENLNSLSIGRNYLNELSTEIDQKIINGFIPLDNPDLIVLKSIIDQIPELDLDDKSPPRIIHKEHNLYGYYEFWEGRIKELRLKSLALKEIPSQISDLTALKKLNLTGNLFTSIPPDIVKLTQLEKLHLDGNRKLITLPKEIGKMENLQFLYIRKCKNLVIPESLLKNKRIKISK